MTDSSDLQGGLSCTPENTSGWGYRTFTLIEHPSDDIRVIPPGDPGNAGNLWLADRPLYDPHANRAVVGTLRLRGVVIKVVPGNPKDQLLFADAEHLLSDGKL